MTPLNTYFIERFFSEHIDVLPNNDIFQTIEFFVQKQRNFDSEKSWKLLSWISKLW